MILIFYICSQSKTNIMPILQIYDTDNEEFGLFISQTDNDKQPIIDKCWKDALNKQNNESNDLYEVFEELLEKNDIKRFFVEEYYINEK